MQGLQQPGWLAKQAFLTLGSVVVAVGMLEASAVTCLQVAEGKLRHSANAICICTFTAWMCDESIALQVTYESNCCL